MGSLSLPTCHYFGPYPDDNPPQRLTLPTDWSGDPFEYLPAEYTLSPEELELANRYENSDLSGGYLRSQIAYFRKPKSKQRHQERRICIETLKSEVARHNLSLPLTFLQLTDSDDYIDRIRHNTIWLSPVPLLVPLPAAPEHKLVPIFYEGQGCEFWYLLLSPNQSHRMICGDQVPGAWGEHVGGYVPDIATFTFYECAPTFDEWLAFYFLECSEGDKNYSEMLNKYPNM